MRLGKALVVFTVWRYVVMLWAPCCSLAQSLGAEDESDEEFVVRDSDVGYIDSAILGNVVRLRLDSTYDLDRPNRAEFFYAAAQPVGAGLPRPEVAVDLQQLRLYTEYRARENVSAFVELGGISLNPVVNDNTTGWGDINAGAKFRLWEDNEWLATAQLRVYAPTGDADRGLGTGHASLEPGLLMVRRLSPWWKASGELRYWTALGGSPFAGDLLQFGLGLQYERWRSFGIEPVGEVVGWTVLSGQESFLSSPSAVPIVTNAKGDTIVNIKLGARVKLHPQHDLYLGYGRALTDAQWYENIFRMELRYAF